MIGSRDLTNELTVDLMRDEGVELKPYRDTKGKLTIGVGRNLDDVGITRNEAMLLLANDIENAKKDLDCNVPWWRGLPHDVRRGLLNMCYNMGWPRLSGFKKMLAALEIREFDVAAVEALDSLWARQVGDRATRVADLIRKGED